MKIELKEDEKNHEKDEGAIDLGIEKNGCGGEDVENDKNRAQN